jgi:hypothetical protein
MLRGGFLGLCLVFGCLTAGCGPTGSALPPPLPPPPAAVPAVDGADSPEEEPVLFGRFRHVGGATDLEARDAAIDRVTGELPFMVRSRAGAKLRERNAISPEITISKAGEDVNVDFAGKVVFTATLGAAPTAVTTPDGRELELSYAMHDASLVQTLQGPKGGMRRVYTALPAGKLVVQVAVSAEALPKPIEYDLHYLRDDTATSPTDG